MDNRREREREARIQNLSSQVTKHPQQQPNINAIISYYEMDGELPTPGGKIVYAFGGKVKRDTVDRFRRDVDQEKSIPWIEVIRFRFHFRLHWYNDTSLAY
ncbi:hypothetical protein AAE478_009494 [Parahypoxylon ruwenzoriense]